MNNEIIEEILEEISEEIFGITDEEFDESEKIKEGE